jgi:hypothetical protein
MGGAVDSADAYQGFQQGGSPGFAGPSDMAALLAAQAQMFGPYAQAGLYGGAPGGLPGGGGSYVPQGSLPVSSLTTAGSLPEAPSVLDTLEQAAKIGEAGSNVYKKYQEYQERKRKREAETPTPTPSSSTVGPRMAAGGEAMPYGSGTGAKLNIPTSSGQSFTLSKPGKLADQESGLDELEKILDIASKASSMGKNKAAGGTAGREGFQDGGTKKKEQGLFSEILQDIQDYAGYGVTAESAAAQRQKLAQRDRTGATGSFEGAPDPVKPTALPTNRPRPPASHYASGGRSCSGSGRTACCGSCGHSATGSCCCCPDDDDSGRLRFKPFAGAKRSHCRLAVNKLPKLLSGARESLSKPENLIPLLSGIAAMGTAPTYNLGVALAAGLGAGTKSYTDIRKQMADIEKTKADTQQSRVLTAAEAQTIPQNAIFVRAGITYVMLADGKTVTLAEWHKMGKPPTAGTAQAAGIIKTLSDAQPVSGASVPAATTPAPPEAPSVPGKAAPTEGDKAVKDYGWNPTISETNRAKAQSDSEALLAMPEAQRNAFIQKSIADEEATFANAASAAEAGTSLNQLARQISALDGPLGTGPLNQMKTTFAAYVNDVMNTFGVPQEYRILEKDVDRSIIANKLSTALQFEGVQQAGQRAFQALNQIAAATPGPGMPKEAALEIIGNMYIDKQKSLDAARYLEDYKELASMPGMYKSAQAQLAFRTDYNDQFYETQRQRLNEILRAKDPKTGTTLVDDILLGKVDPKQLDEELGMPGFSRYFFNR